MRLTADVPDLLITSPANPRLKAVVALRRRRTREETGTTLVEGHEELTLALASGVRPETLFVCPELFSPAGHAGRQEIGRQEDLVAHARQLGAEVVRLSRTAFEKVAYREGPDGLLAVVPAVGRALSHARHRRRRPPPRGPGSGEAGQPRSHAPHRRCRWCDRRRRGRSGDRLGQPERRPRQQGNGVRRPRRGRHDGRGPGLADRPPGAARRHHAGHRPALHRRRSDRSRWPSRWGPRSTVPTTTLLDAAAYRVRIPMHGKANSLNVAASAAIVLFEARPPAHGRGTVSTGP